MLLYADDIMLMVNGTSDLQCMLELLADSCEYWVKNVKSCKTKVVHFRPKGRNMTNVSFQCGGCTIEVTDRYKYLRASYCKI